jgi:hypothetical protein
MESSLSDLHIDRGALYAATRVTAVTIREASADDAEALRRLAQLDSSPVPATPVLVAEADGRLRAALSIEDGTAIADPFHPSAGLVSLLRTHVALRRRRSAASRVLGRSRWSALDASEARA